MRKKGTPGGRAKRYCPRPSVWVSDPVAEDGVFSSSALGSQETFAPGMGAPVDVSVTVPVTPVVRGSGTEGWNGVAGLEPDLGVGRGSGKTAGCLCEA